MRIAEGTSKEVTLPMEQLQRALSVTGLYVFLVGVVTLFPSLTRTVFGIEVKDLRRTATLVPDLILSFRVRARRGGYALRRQPAACSRCLAGMRLVEPVANRGPGETNSDDAKNNQEEWIAAVDVETYHARAQKCPREDCGRVKRVDPVTDNLNNENA